MHNNIIITRNPCKI